MAVVQQQADLECVHCCGNCYEPDVETCDVCGEWIRKPFTD